MKHSISKKGFTLIEMLVYISILAIIILGVISFFVWTTRAAKKIFVTEEVVDNIRRSMKTITQEIREAESIYTPTTTSEQLSLETTKYLPTGEERTYIDFYLCEEHLCFKKESQDPIVLTSDKVEVNNLKFTKINTDPASIQVNLGINFKESFQYQSSINATSTVSLRSY